MWLQFNKGERMKDRMCEILGTRDLKTGLRLCVACSWDREHGLQITEIWDISSWNKDDREELYPNLANW